MVIMRSYYPHIQIKFYSIFKFFQIILSLNIIVIIMLLELNLN